MGTFAKLDQAGAAPKAGGTYAKLDAPAPEKVFQPGRDYLGGVKEAWGGIVDAVTDNYRDVTARVKEPLPSLAEVAKREAVDLSFLPKLAGMALDLGSKATAGGALDALVAAPTGRALAKLPVKPGIAPKLQFDGMTPSLTPARVMTEAESAEAIRGAINSSVQAAKPSGGLALEARVMGPQLPNVPVVKPKPDLATLSPAKRNVRILDEAGVFMTPGQKAGGQLKNLEDIARRAPITGVAIKGAADRSVESLNRAVANQALGPIGEALPKTIPTGHDSVRHVAKTLGKAYDDAAAMVPEAAIDAPFDEAVAAIGTRLAEQPSGVRTQFDTIIDNRLANLRGKTVTGAQIRDAQSQIGKLAADFSASDDGAQRALGGALDDLSDELANIIGRRSPEASALIDKANTGWSIYTRLRNAASKAKGGIATPGQFSTAVRTLDRSVGKGNVAKGQAVLQDLSNAAWEVLPDSYGNPGTADALSAMGLAAAAMNPTTAGAAVPAAVGLTGAAVPYAMMGRKIAERLPQKAAPTPEQLVEAISAYKRPGGRIAAPSGSRLPQRVAAGLPKLSRKR